MDYINAEYDTFDILSKAGIDVKAKVGNIRMTCPLCGKPDFAIYRGGTKHGSWKCFSCGEGGGKLAMFVKIRDLNLNPENNADQVEIHKQAKDFLNLADEKVRWVHKPVPPAPKNEEIAPVEKRDEVYRFVLDLCALSAAHKKELKRRGFRDETIEKNLYRTTPANTVLIVKQLVSKGYQLKGIPGFSKEKDQWKMVNMAKGILIPVVNERGQIQSLIIRRDKADNNKYISVSSVDAENGCKAESCIHVRGKNFNEILVTEGVFKTDITFQQLGVSVVGILGSGIIKGLLEFIERHAVKKVRIALDMDAMTNRHVNKNLDKLKDELSARRIEHVVLIWDARYKGIDDRLIGVL